MQRIQYLLYQLKYFKVVIFLVYYDYDELISFLQFIFL